MHKIKSDIKIVKNLILSLEEERFSGLAKKIDWEAITMGFVFYEIDSKKLYTEIYKLEFSDPEIILSKLDELHQLFIDELAEAYVFGEENNAVKELLKLESQLFNEKVVFLKTLDNVITKVERNRITEEFSSLADRSHFSLSEGEIKSAIKKKARADLKNKFDKWDKELKEEKEKVISFDLPPIASKYSSSAEITKDPKKKVKVISISWIKYAVAALIVISAGYFLYDSNNIDEPHQKVVDAEIKTETVKVMTESTLGYIDPSEEETILITYLIDVEGKKALEEIEKPILEESLKSLAITYQFANNSLTLNSFKSYPDETGVILKASNNKYYLNFGELYFPIIEGETGRSLVAEEDPLIINQLEKILFENE